MFTLLYQYFKLILQKKMEARKNSDNGKRLITQQFHVTPGLSKVATSSCLLLQCISLLRLLTTEHSPFGGLKSGHVFLPAPGQGVCKVGVIPGPFLVAGRWAPSLCANTVFPQCVRAEGESGSQVSLLIGSLILPDWGPPLKTSLDLHDILGGPISRHSHTVGQGFNIRILWDTDFPSITPSLRSMLFLGNLYLLVFSLPYHSS